MRLIIILNNLLLCLFLICEELKRPKKKEDCFERTFVGEYNKANSYCCFLHFIKSEIKILKCSLHFKDEIDNNAIISTIDFLKRVNMQTNSTDEVEIISLDCKINYIAINIFVFVFLIIIMI